MGSKRFQRLPPNEAGRDFVVGDVHGCFSVLDQAIRALDFHPENDRLFSVGDLIDRGPESHRTLEFLAKPWFYAVLGNHERLLLDSGDPEIMAIWLVNGGDWWLEQSLATQNQFRDALTQLPYAIEVETVQGPVGIVHADVPRHMAWPAFVEAVVQGDAGVLETSIWGRSRALGHVTVGVAGIVRVFCGHTVCLERVRQVANVSCIDTGAVYALTAGYPGGLTIMSLKGVVAHYQAL